MPYALIGAAVQGGLQLAATGMNQEFSMKQQEKQIAHNKEMSLMNQEHILEQMEKQNQYNIDAWNLENAYNDPSAVRARYESAGINAAAAFGQGSASGAGIAGSLSTPSAGSSTGHSTNIMQPSPYAGLGAGIGSLINDGLRIKAENKKLTAEAELASERAETERFNNEILLPIKEDLLNLDVDNKTLQNELQKIVNEFTPKLNSANLRVLELGFDKLEAEIDNIYASTTKLISDSELNKSLKDKAIQDIAESKEKMKGYVYERKVKEVNARLLEKEIGSKTFKDLLTLKEAQREEAMREYFKQYAERLASDMRLDDARKRKLVAESQELVSRNMKNLMEAGTEPIKTASSIMNAIGEIIPF